LEKEIGRTIKLAGTEIDLNTLELAKDNGLSSDDLTAVQITDFFLHPPGGYYKAIVANPPYIRHHRLSNALKNELKAFSLNLLGKRLDGRAGYHVYFLLRALQLLEVGGRLAFIMPADTCEGVFSRPLW
jgi:methylase of polypeptide subunit release factors